MALVDLVPEEYRAPGLSADELAAAQEHAEVLFPADLCELLTETLPTGRGFPNWRTHARESLDSFCEWIIDGIHFDALHDGFWPQPWGERPANPQETYEVVAQHVHDAPALIPLYSHRGLPNEPLEPGNPIFSVHQTDVIVYGSDLSDYLLQEFHPSRARRSEPSRAKNRSEIREIRFWAQMLDTDHWV